MEKAKNRGTVLVFVILLLGGMLLHLLLPDQEISRSERRRLAQAPEASGEALLSGQYAQDLEDYLLDQFPGRESLRTLKAVWTYYVLGQQDNNGVYLSQGTAAKLDSELDPVQVQRFVDKMNEIHELHLSDSTVYCAVIPDKNYYLDCPKLDYNALLETVETGLPWADHIDLTGSLTLADYYATDSHWRQERLDRVAGTLSQSMNLDLPSLEAYDRQTLSGFRGVYYGQSALPLPPEDLVYLENDATQAAVVTGPELKGEQTVYDPARFAGLDGYDVFLHGAQAVLTLENPLAETDRELIVFRDSYGSSLTPLLLSGCKTVTLVDIRYVSAANLGKFVDFHGQDVLLLYSTTVINSAGILR